MGLIAAQVEYTRWFIILNIFISIYEETNHYGDESRYGDFIAVTKATNNER